MSLFEGVFGKQDSSKDLLFSKDSQFYRQNQKEEGSKSFQTQNEQKIQKVQRDKQKISDEFQPKSAAKLQVETKNKIVEPAKNNKEPKIAKKRKKRTNVEDLYEVQDGRVKKKKTQQPVKLVSDEEEDEEDAAIEEMMKEMQTDNETVDYNSDEEETQVRPKQSAKRDAEQISRTIFVGNLPANIKRPQLRQLFQDCAGEVQSLRFRGIAILKECTKPMHLVCGLSQYINKEHTSKHAYVVFEDKSSVDKAKQFNMRVLWGHHVTIKPYMEQELDPLKSVFIANLAEDVQDEEVIRLFHGDEVGELHKEKVTGIRLIRDNRTRLSRGVGFIEFKNRKTAKAIIEFDNKFTLRGKNVRIHEVDPKKAHKTTQSFAYSKLQGNGKQSWQGVQTRGGKDKQIRGASRKQLSGNFEGKEKVQKKKKTGKRPAVAERKRKQLEINALLRNG